MLHKLKQRKQGFTIIEVLIVLAIAGLILLIVFLAVPALQRNSKNTQRKNDVQAVLGAVQEYTNNNSGQLPKTYADASDMLANAKLGFFQSGKNTATTALPTSTAGLDLGDANVSISSAGIQTGTPKAFPSSSKMYIRLGAKCDTNNDFTATGASSRSIAVGYTIETNSGTKPVCQES